MIIKSLLIQDFGIIQGQELRDLNNGINVIAGPNRAGKTTLMQLLRYLGYKFPKTDLMPAPKVSRRARATMQLEDGAEVILERDGQSDPVLAVTSGSRDISIEDIFHVDDFTYRQLFTISLDELRRFPAGVDGKKESRRLQSVLLGAGLTDAANLSEVLRDFRKQAEDIGGKHGNQRVSEFKDHNQDIREAVEQRKEANQQIRIYQENLEEKNEVESELAALKEQKSSLEKRRVRLEFLHQYAETFLNYRNLTDELSGEENRELLTDFEEEYLSTAKRLLETYPEVIEKYGEAKRDFKRQVPGDKWQEVKNSLLNATDEIRRWERELSGLREQIQTFRNEQQQIAEKREEIATDLGQVNSDWGEDFTALETIRTDRVDRAVLREKIAEFLRVTDRKRGASQEIDTLEQQVESIEDEISEIESHRKIDPVKMYGVGLLIIISGILLGILTYPWIGLLVGIGGVGVLVVRYLGETEARQQMSRLESELRQTKKQLQSRKSELEDLESKWEKLNEEVGQYRDTLGLPAEVHPESLRNYFDDVADLKKRIAQWNSQREDLKRAEQDILENLDDLRGVLDNIYPEDIGEPAIDDADELMHRITQASEWLDSAKDLNSLEEQKEDQEKQIHRICFPDSGQMNLDDAPSTSEDYIRSLEEFVEEGQRYSELTEKEDEAERLAYSLENGFNARVKSVFTKDSMEDAPDTLEDLLNILEEYYEQFASEKEIADNLRSVENSIEQVTGEITDAQKRVERLNVRLEELATTEKLEQAQEQIDKARSRLEPLAREFAINRIATAILEQAQERFMHRTRDELLTSASEYFRRITSDDYASIALPKELENADFVSLTEDGNSVETTRYLSRGTREQLFMSVRLSRIKEITPPLPVILDDSLVNFDSAHRRQAVRVLQELAKTNQIFVMTCHPELVEFLHEAGDEISYMTIDAGVIAGSSYTKVLEHLRR
ncbi:MAG: AAA family ATPase [Candidatus Marinimicrobia bacterium]|nr:AAA family ATPase [Candidatus Neomarinimicrobiota bacterium]MCF7828162.1 AAA family ATPase [Candidatus Neomarinimicrobiota bacterium]MCF7879663.1 AAA family ATPase [Candidatus Neomarinimicrobiota bacterium]